MNAYLQQLLTEIKEASSKANLQSEFENAGHSYTEALERLKEYFSTIQEKADLDGETIEKETEYWSDFKNALADKAPWNESLNNLINLYEEIYSRVDTPTILKTDSAIVNGKIITSFGKNPPETFNSEDIRQGDAGNAFGNAAKWVKPWYNSDANSNGELMSYSAVRGSDKAIPALVAETNLQVTREQTEEIVEQIRLLMPKNTRRVEIEDLNRNFWVIAQVITGISAYIFGEGSPYTDLLNGILKELFQLWENVLYQWAAINFLKEEVSDKVHIEYLPIPVDSFRPYKKYDDFAAEWGEEDWGSYLTAIKNNLDYIQYKYSEFNLVIIPLFRFDNYQKNYYSKAIIPYIAFYNRGAEEWSYCKIVVNNKPIIVNTSLYKEYLYGARELETKYRYTYPLAYAESQFETDDSHRYYSAIRIVPEAKAEVNEGLITISSLKFSLTDGIENIVNKETQTLIATYDLQESVNEDSEIANFTYNLAASPASESSYVQFQDITPQRGYWLGEMPSCFYDSLHKNNYDVVDNTVIGKAYMMRVANFFSTNLPLDQAAYGGTDVPSNRWTYERSLGGPTAPTDYLWNLAYTTFPYAYAGSDYSLYQPYYRDGQIYVRNCGDRNSITYSKMKEIAQQSISDFIINNRHLDSSNGFYISDFSNGYGNSDKDKNAGITYFFSLIGVGQNHGTTGYGNPDSFISHCFRYFPKRLEILIDLDSVTTLTENINGKTEVIGYLQYLGKINKSTSYAAMAQVGYISSGLHLQQLLSEQQVANYIAIHVNETINGFIDINQLPKDIQAAYQSAESHEAAAQILVDYLDTLTKDEIDDLVKTDEDIKEMIKFPTIYWQDYDGRNFDTSGNIDTYKTIVNCRQLVKMELKSQKEESSNEFTFYPSYLCCRRSSSGYNLAAEKKLYSLTYTDGYTQGGVEENYEYYKWTGQESYPLTYSDVFVSTHSLGDNQHFSIYWTGEN